MRLAGNSPLQSGLFPNMLLAMTSQQKLLDEVEQFVTSTGMSPSRFGLEAMNDTKLVSCLRAGVCPRLDTADRIRDFMKKHSKGPMQAAE